MLKGIAVLGLMVTLGSVLVAPVFAAAAIQGSVANITSTDNMALGSSGSGQSGTAGCRVYSLSDPGINNNFGGTCLNARCLRPYSTARLQPGGYICNGEGTAAYANDRDSQTFYQLIDSQANAGSCGHIAYFAVQGQIASSGNNINYGDFRDDGCPGISATNCFERAGTGDSRTTPLLGTHASYGPGGPHTISSIGGLSPVPTVRVSQPGSGGCPAGQSRLTWDDPETYAATMKNGVPSPLSGIRLYSNSSLCSECPDGDTGWTALAVGADQPLGAGAAGICAPVIGDTWFAMTVRVRGPGTDPNSELETGKVGDVGFVGANSQCVGTLATVVRIANLSARYAGRGTVNIDFTTGNEGDVQGYYVTRCSSPNGPFSRVSEQLSARGDSSVYGFSDKVRSVFGRTLYYSVEIVNFDGTTERSGPWAVNLPAAKRKLGAQ